MAHLNIQSQHLVELSDEQQELVSGGLAAIDAAFSQFKSDNEVAEFAGLQQSGPNGTVSASAFKIADLETYTSGARFTAFDTDA